MDGEPNSLGSCYSQAGKRKQRWPNSMAAWFVCLLLSQRTEAKKKYAYLCDACDGWHVASCRSGPDRKRHKRGLVILQRRLDAMKTSQIAGKKK